MSTSNKLISPVTSISKSPLYENGKKIMKEQRLESKTDNLVTTDGQVHDCGVLIPLKD